MRSGVQAWDRNFNNNGPARTDYNLETFQRPPTLAQTRGHRYNSGHQDEEENVICPHCLSHYHEALNILDLGTTPDKDCFWRVVWQQCPACLKFVIYLERSGPPMQGVARRSLGLSTVYPKAIARKPLPADVIPPKIVEDYKEACLVLADSPKASAALSRRCLQTVLREKAKVKPQDLSKEIDEVLASNQLPSHLANDVDVIRHIGNFAAHSIKSTSTGEIVDVEAGEAEWQLDVLEGLFDFYFVGPAESKTKRDALNAKLADVGKPPVKQP